MFVRPEVITFYRRNRPFILAGMVALFGLYIVLNTRGFGYVAGGVIIAIAGLLAHDAYRRMRFPVGEDGPGVVDVTERQITYLSAMGGGAVSLDALHRVEVHRNAQGRLMWMFYAGGDSLAVPGDAEGVAALFEALIALPGVDLQQAEAANTGKGTDIFLVWAK
ncbi:MAG: hypothetical protein ACWA40_00545 [Planktomarina sp.]